MTWDLGKTVLFRSAIFVGMASVVTTIIYFSPKPVRELVSCHRECHELEMPMICRVRIVLELVPANRASDCQDNSTGRGCPSDNGDARWVMAANRQLPGPNIHVCQHDILVVDVVNKMAGVETAVHWRGQRVLETPFMDGVAMVTQCPVSAGATWQYKVRAAQPGTHLWHAQVNAALLGDGAFGALVVRQAASQVTHAALYDHDDEHHVAVVGASADGAAIAVNGRPPGESATFELVSGARHLLRLANAFGLQRAGRGRCSVSVSLQGHELLVVALDGHPIQPRRASSLQLVPGERADVVVSASKPEGGVFSLRVDADRTCAVEPGVASVRYAAAPTPTPTPTPTPGGDVSAVTTLSDAASCADADACLPGMRAHRPMAHALRAKHSDVNLFLAFGYRELAAAGGSRGQPMTPETNASSHSTSLAWAPRRRVAATNNLTFSAPASPLLTQPDDVDAATLCGGTRRRPTHCSDADADADAATPCECVHVVDVELGASVEILLADNGGSSRRQVFHLHGQSFHVVGVRAPTPTPTPTQLSEAEARRLDVLDALFARNLEDAVAKDTVAVPVGGLVALRFEADNPGYWLLENAQEPGMSVVLHVGAQGDAPPTPAESPRCRGFQPPDYFLI